MDKSTAIVQPLSKLQLRRPGPIAAKAHVLFAILYRLVSDTFFFLYHEINFPDSLLFNNYSILYVDCLGGDFAFNLPPFSLIFYFSMLYVS